ncbi:MAG: hypothetical protein DCC75_07865 [Proteobacteria bacterium]|nr:MAG: hypothetical protein DCC75_07865 [Pseudomonadota bacterium]
MKRLARVRINSRKERNSSYGALIVLTAVCIIALLALVVLAIDLTRMYYLKMRYERLSQAACLGALNQFLITVENPSTSYNDKKAAAIMRAMGILAVSGEFKSPLNPSDLQNMLNQPDSLDQERNGRVLFGWYRRSDPCEGVSGTCDSGCWDDANAPCLDVSVPGVPEPASPNAIQIQINLSQESPLLTLLGGFMGPASEFLFRTYATCAITPRQVISLVDLSSSVAFESHKPLRAVTLPAPDTVESDPIPDTVPDNIEEFIRLNSVAEFSYLLHYQAYPQLNWEQYCTYSTSNLTSDNLCNLPPPPAVPHRPPSFPSYCPVVDRVYYPNMLGWPVLPYQSMLQDRGSDTNPTTFYMSDYRCRTVGLKHGVSYLAAKHCYESCLSYTQSPVNTPAIATIANCLNDSSNPACNPPTTATSNQGGIYLIDTWGPRNGRRPEPLYTILSAVHTLLDEFLNRANSRDLVGLVGFANHAFTPLQYFPLTQPIPLQINGQPITGAANSIFQQMRTLTDVETSNTTAEWDAQQKQQLLRIFFPRVSEATNIDQSLRVAMMMLAERRDLQARADVILFSDGIGNCYNTNQGQLTWANCANTIAAYLQSFAAISSLATQYFAPAKVSVNVALTGSYTRSNTKLMKGRDGCMTTDEAQLRGQSGFVDGNDYDAGGSPLQVSSDEQGEFANRYRNPLMGGFAHPNRLYDSLVLPTDGMWMPLRPCCKIGGSCASASTVKSEFRNRCLGQDGEAGTIVTPSSTMTSNGWVDSYGRVLCDPEGLTPQQQMQNYIEKLMRNNTIFLVGAPWENP